MEVLITDGFVILMCGAFSFLCAWGGTMLGAKRIGKIVARSMYTNVENMVSKEEAKITRSNI